MNHSFSAHCYKIFFWLVIISFLSACQSTGPFQAYEGPKKAANEVATFIVPTNYNLLSINGVHYQKKFLEEGATINLLPGTHQLIIEYHDLWDLTGQEHEKVTSKPIAVTLTIQAGIQYGIDSVLLETVEQAQAFAEKPSIKIVDTTNKQDVPAKIKYNLYGKSLFTMLFGTSLPDQYDSPDNNEEMETSDKNKTPLDRLKDMWGKADETQKNDFRQWLDNH